MSSRRCLGFTRTWRRCERIGPWRVYCGDHKRQPIAILLFLIVSAIPAYFAYRQFIQSAQALPRPAESDLERTTFDDWTIRQQELSDEEKNAMLAIVDLTQSGRFPEAEDALARLTPRSAFSSQFKDEYSAALYLGTGEFKRALESILARYEGLPRTDARYRWEIAYVIYFLRREKGVTAAERTIADLQRKYRRGDLSFVWMGIHPPALLRLIEYRVSPGQRLHETQEDILESVITQHPEDPYLDHALYFLRRFDELIARYPSSPLLDRALYGRAVSVDPTADPHNADERSSALTAFNAYLAFLQRFPSSPLAVDALYRATSVAVQQLAPAEAVARVRELRRGIQQWHRDGSLTKTEADLYNVQVAHAFTRAFEALDLAAARQVLDVLRDGAREVADAEALQLCYARRLFQSEQFAEALVAYGEVNPGLFYSGESLRLEALTRIAAATAIADERERALQIGLALKGTRYDTEKAIPYFRFYGRGAARDETVRTEMLIAYCYRDAGMGREYRQALQEIVIREPAHPLADDALAELGVFELLWTGRMEQGRDLLRSVLARYPGANAADNAQNWIAWSYMEEEKYEDAAAEYLRLIELTGVSRFADYAFRNLVKLGVVGAGQWRHVIAKYIADAKRGGEAVVVRMPGGSQRVVAALESGDLIQLDVEFQIGTRVDRPRRVQLPGGPWFLFAGEDVNWATRYLWDVGGRELYFRAVERKTGAVRESGNLNRSDHARRVVLDSRS